eukprot:140167_1
MSNGKGIVYCLLLVALFCLSSFCTETSDSLTVVDEDGGNDALAVRSAVQNKKGARDFILKKARVSSALSFSSHEFKRLIVSTLDGSLHAIDPQTGKIMWTLMQDEPLVSTHVRHPSQDPLVVPGIDGSLYRYRRSQNDLMSLQVSIKEIVERAPIRNPDGDRFLGSKSTKMLVIDLDTGKVIHAHVPGMAFGDCPPLKPGQQAITIAKTEFVVRAFAKDSHDESWNVTVSEFDTFADDPLRNAPFSIAASVNGMIYLREPSDLLRWARHLHSPLSTVFAVDVANTLRRLPHGYMGVAGTVTGMDGPPVGVFGTPVSPREEYLYVGYSKTGELYVIPNVPPIRLHDNDPPVKHVSTCTIDSPNFPACLQGFHVIMVERPEYNPVTVPALPAPLNTETEILDTEHGGGAVSVGEAVFMAIIFGIGLWSLLGRQLNVLNKSDDEAEIGLQNSPQSQPISEVDMADQKSSYSGRISGFSGRSSGFSERYSEIRKIDINHEVVLGMGSHGTMVYDGRFEGRPVAVKRLLKHFYEDASKEIAVLIDSDQHPNVLRYFARDEDHDFIYIALERCQLSLSDLVEEQERHAELLVQLLDLEELSVEDDRSTSSDASDSSFAFPLSRYLAGPKTVTLMRDIFSGICHLHQLNIVHRDLKPQNILINMDNKAKVADMGLSKKLESHRSSFDSVASGSLGWQAPEVISGGGRLTRAIDVFSLGCVLYFVLTMGGHPYGDRYERDAHIRDGVVCTDRLAHAPEARDLVERMVALDLGERFTIRDALAHPFFWEDEMKLQFLIDVSDRIETDRPDSEVRITMESRSSRIIGNHWGALIDPELISNVGQYRKYNFGSIRDCLRVIRNKRNHYRELPPEVQAMVGSLPGGFLRYFTSRFPRLLLYAFAVMGSLCGDEPALRKYFVGMAGDTRRMMFKEVQIGYRQWFPPREKWLEQEAPT